MLRGMAQLTTAGDVIKAVAALFVGLAMGAGVTAFLGPGALRVCAQCVVGAAMIGVIGSAGLGVFRRYRQLSDGKCPNPLCHGVVQRSQLVDRGHVVCPTCKKVWPELTGMQFRATARG
ncbi:MAG: BRcat domain-containing protein [Armatimonadota bacterium]